MTFFIIIKHEKSQKWDFLISLDFCFYFFKCIQKELNAMEHADKPKNKKKDLEYLLKGIDLKSIQLEIDIRNGSKKVENLFWLICILFATGSLCIIFLFLHQYKYI
uniref:Uncharacterized protein n=1 Tax=Curvibacter symbiont subsp. Hydra magnipapillata TaxID=667019 RepID=C9Y6Q0_CURXX|nr:hypothetical protein Csp_E36270 [Curvibacter putative symbiont of Hydra magnipapillata]